MAIIDSLGFAVDTSGLKQARTDLVSTGKTAKIVGDDFFDLERSVNKVSAANYDLARAEIATKKALQSGLITQERANDLLREYKNRSNNAEKAQKRFGKTLGSVKASVFSLQGAIGALGVGLVFREVLQANEAWTNQTNALKLVTGSSKELIQVQTELFDLAQRTRSSTAGTVDLYSRLARSTKELGISQSRLVGVTETVNKAIAASGASGASADAALFQLGQGLAAGALRGEELNSVMEQTPRLAQALAEGLGVGTGELRKLGEQGKLTSEVVIAALENQAKAVDDEFNQTTKTVSQATTQLANEIEKTLGSIDNQGLIDSIDSIRKTLSDPAVVEGIQTLAQGLITSAEWAVKAAAGFANIGKAIGNLTGKLFYGELNKEAEQANMILRDQAEKVNKLESTFESYAKNREALAASNADKITLAAFDEQIQRQKLILDRERERLRLIQGINSEQAIAAKEPKKAAAIEEAIPAKPIIGVGEDKEEKKLQDQLQKRFESLQQGYFNETQLAIQAFNERTALITELEMNKIGTDEERRQLSLESYAQFEAELTSITEEEANKREEVANKERQARLSITTDMLSNLAALTSSKSRVLFQIGKTAAIANATVKGHEAVVGAYAEGAKIGGPYLGAAYAVTAGIAVAQQIAQISSTSFQGGGSISSPGGGGVSAGGGQAQVSDQPPALAATQQDIPQREISIVMPEGLRSDAEVRALLERINEVNQDLGGNSKLVVA